MKSLLFLSILLVVFLAGCTTVSSYVGIIQIDELYTNYENFQGKAVRTAGKYTYAFGGDNLLISDQGYKLIVNSCIEESRYYDVGSTYVAEGVVSCSTECICISEITYPEDSTSSCRNQVIETPSRQTCAIGISEAGCSIASATETQSVKGIVKRYCKDTPSIVDCKIECETHLEKR